MIIGKTDEGKSLKIDLPRLIESRLLLQANSGGGKSWAIRRILEQTHGHVQQIVIDVEDEFHTLREKFDYVLAGSGGGDCPADLRSAALLARRLLELNVSAIIGIYELRAHDRIRFVRLFLDSLVNAPRDLWHPVLVVVDEAHMFAPQQGQAESTGAVIDLMTRGRKRGFCGILATQRISKLHKDAAAEANNKMIGRSALDVDMKRAADELGFSSREDQTQLRALKPGEFFCFGPALSDQVTKAKVEPILTTHPRAGQRAAPPPPAQERVKKVLAQLADLPREAEEEARTVGELRAKVAQLERERRAPPAPDEKEVVRAWEAGYRESLADNKKQNAALWDSSKEAFRRLEKIRDLTALPPPDWFPESGKSESAKILPKTLYVNADTKDFLTRETKSALSRCARSILQVLAQFPDGRNASQLAILTGYSIQSSGFGNALSELRTAGLIEGGRDLMKMTSSGVNAAGGFKEIPSGAQLLQHWMGKLGKAERGILSALAQYVHPLSKQEIADLTGYSMTSSGFSNALSKLRVLELISGKDQISIRPELL